MSLIREEIDNETLIKAVEKRPSLYNKNVTEYSDLEKKTRHWEEISALMFPHTWCKMTADEKDKSVREIQKRWRNLRACFTREIRLQKRSNADSRRRRYHLFNKLKFLSSSIDQEVRSSRADENGSEDGTEEYLEMHENTSDAQIDISSLRGNDTNPNELSYNNNSLIDFEEVTCGRPEVTNSTNVNLDPDLNFALSLVPTLRMVPSHSRIDAQIAVLNTLRKFVSGQGNSHLSTIRIECNDN